MGKRLTKIYTRTGDDGTTGLAKGQRIGKQHPRIEAIGTVDELNSHLGLLIALDPPQPIKNQLSDIQHDLFDLGGELSLPDTQILHAERIDSLEKSLDQMNEKLPPLREFILPGGGQLAAQCHVARSVCRRAERRLIALMSDEALNIVMVHYLNRLSDWLFVCARILAREAGEGEVFWRSRRQS